MSLDDCSVPEFREKVRDIESYVRFLKEKFRVEYGDYPDVKEERSWRNSLPALANEILSDPRLQDAYIFIEFEVPTLEEYKGRIDALLVGKRGEKSYGVIIENKQWSRISRKNQGINKVKVTYYGNTYITDHPTAQVREYFVKLKSYCRPFSTDEVLLDGCSFLHNMEIGVSFDALLVDSYYTLPKEYPPFVKGTFNKMKDRLAYFLRDGRGREVAEIIKSGGYYPSKKLLDYINETIQGVQDWILIGPQEKAFKKVVKLVKTTQPETTAQKKCIIVKGGPGTGKSVIAIQLLAYAARKGWHCAFAIGNNSLLQNLVGKVEVLDEDDDLIFQRNGRFVQAQGIFKSDSIVAQLGSNRGLEILKNSEGKEIPEDSRIVEYNATPREGYVLKKKGFNKKHDFFKLLIVDEAHRLWYFNQVSIGNKRLDCSDVPMVQEMMKIANVTVFFLDEFQSIRCDEIGTIEYFRNQVQSLTGAAPIEYELNYQFRCIGGISYIKFIDYCFKNISENSSKWKTTNYKFIIKDTMKEIQEKIDNLKLVNPYDKIRILAGRCWTRKGSRADIEIKEGEYTWGANWFESAGKDKGSESIWYKWNNENSYDNTVGTVYLTLGFDYDYVILIFGNDLVIRNGQWVFLEENCKDGDIKNCYSKDPDRAIQKVKNVYRILMTRGMKGTYIYFIDDETKNYFKNKLEE